MMISVVSFIIFNSCAGERTDQKIRGVNVFYHLPVVKQDGSIMDIDTYYDVFFSGDLIMYKYVYRYDSSINGRVMLYEDRNNFFVFHKDSLYGYIYDPNPYHIFPDRRLPVDSVLKKNSFESTRFDTLSNLKPDTTYTDKEGNLLKIYIPSEPKTDPSRFVLYFYYNKNLVGINETFSKKMDNLPDMKLCKIKILANEVYDEMYKMSFPKREIYYEMKEIPSFNQKMVAEYFDKYKIAM